MFCDTMLSLSCKVHTKLGRGRAFHDDHDENLEIPPYRRIGNIGNILL